jgi:hypothetical protein
MREGDRMTRLRMGALILIAGLQAAFGAVDGTVVNKTTGKPEAGVTVLFVKPGAQGMQTLGTTVSDARGSFRFDNDQPGGGPQLLQATYKGVNYNKFMPPTTPTSGLELDVYESTKSPETAHVLQHMLFLEPSASQITVTETLIIQNETNETYSDEKVGSIRFYLPPAADGQARVSVKGPQGMPLPRPAERTEQGDTYKVNFPIKPGETQFEVTYILPAGTPYTYRGRVVNVKGMPGGPVRLIAPAGVTLAGKDIQSVGTEPKTQATVYTVLAADDFSAEVTGLGSLRGADSGAETDASDSPQVVEGRPKIYAHMTWLLVLAFSILGVGLVTLFRTSPVRSISGK